MVRLDNEGRPVLSTSASGGAGSGQNLPPRPQLVGGAGGAGGGVGPFGLGGAGGFGGGGLGLGGPFASSQGSPNQIGWHGGQQGGHAGGSANQMQVNQFVANMALFKAGAITGAQAIAPSGMALIAGGGGPGSGNLFAIYADPNNPASQAVQTIAQSFQRTQENRLGITPEHVDPTGYGRTIESESVDVANSENTTVNGDTVVVNGGKVASGDAPDAGSQWETLGTVLTGDNKLVTIKNIVADTATSAAKMAVLGLQDKDATTRGQSARDVVASVMSDASKYAGGLATTSMVEDLSAQLRGVTTERGADAIRPTDPGQGQTQINVVVNVESLNDKTDVDSLARELARKIDVGLRKPQQGAS